MKQDDEKFLKEVLWSEAWFPWRRKNAIFVRGHERNSTELLALILSALALIVSAVATIGTWKQTDLMQEQLTAAERNSGKLRISESLLFTCRTIKDGPVRARKWKFYQEKDGTPGKRPLVKGEEFVITLAEREAFANTLDDLRYSLASTSLYLAFSNESTIALFESLIQKTDESLRNAIEVLDAPTLELDYVQLRKVGEACSQHISNAVAEAIGAGPFDKRPQIELD
jgi:hypothetical protein